MHIVGVQKPAHGPRGGIDLIDQACQQVGTELRHQYTLGYYPTNKNRDGTYRRIRVKIRNAGYTVRTRDGYYVLRGASSGQ